MAEDPPSDKQVALLKKLGCTTIPETKRLAGDKIKELLGNKDSKSNTEKPPSPPPKTASYGTRNVSYPLLQELSGDDQELLISFDKIMSMAVLKTKEYNPELNEGDNVFGQITSANADRIVQLLLIKAIRESSTKPKKA